MEEVDLKLRREKLSPEGRYGKRARVSSGIYRERFIKPVLHPAKQCPKLGCLVAELGPGLLGSRLAVSF